MKSFIKNWSPTHRCADLLTVYLRQKGSSQSKPVDEATYSQGE